MWQDKDDIGKCQQAEGMEIRLEWAEGRTGCEDMKTGNIGRSFQ